MGNYLETLKNISKDKKKEKLIYVLILCVVLFIATSYIFNDDKKTGESSTENTTNNTGTESNINSDKDAMEQKLAKILSEISGIGNVSVMITYNSDKKINPVYNTKEEEKDGQKTLDRSVVYNEQDSNKTIVIESTNMPTVEGVIVVAIGASNVEIRSKIAQAVSAITNVAIYKIQVFEKKG